MDIWVYWNHDLCWFIRCINFSFFLGGGVGCVFMTILWSGWTYWASFCGIAKLRTFSAYFFIVEKYCKILGVLWYLFSKHKLRNFFMVFTMDPLSTEQRSCLVLTDVDHSSSAYALHLHPNASVYTRPLRMKDWQPTSYHVVGFLDFFSLL